MIYFFIVIATAAYAMSGLLLTSPYFLLETRLELGALYLLLGTNAATAAAILVQLRYGSAEGDAP